MPADRFDFMERYGLTVALNSEDVDQALRNEEEYPDQIKAVLQVTYDSLQPTHKGELETADSLRASSHRSIAPVDPSDVNVSPVKRKSNFIEEADGSTSQNCANNTHNVKINRACVLLNCSSSSARFVSLITAHEEFGLHAGILSLLYTF